MAETATTDFNARMYTTHGVKKNQGKWARVNNQVALTYTEGKGDNERVVGYTPYEDMIRLVMSDQLPEYHVDF